MHYYIVWTGLLSALLVLSDFIALGASENASASNDGKFNTEKIETTLTLGRVDGCCLGVLLWMALTPQIYKGPHSV